SVVRELAEEHQMPIWEEWVSERQLGVFFLLQGDQEHNLKLVMELVSKLNEWIQEYMPFTVTVAIGTTASNLREIPNAFNDAVTVSQYKSVIGANRVIGFWEVLRDRDQQNALKHLHVIRQLTTAFKSGDALWRTQYNRFFQATRESM